MTNSAPSMPKRRGVMLVLTSPSGAGKSTIARELLRSDDNIKLSVSVTTRKQRPSEIDGVHYHFITPEEFHLKRERDELLEWAEVHGNFYATPRAQVEAQIANGQDVLFDIDFQGTLQLYQTSAADIASIFILPPSIKELASRLKRRAEDSKETIAKRLKNGALELAHWNEFDYVLINKDLDSCYNKVVHILAAEREKRSRNSGLSAFVESLQNEIKAL